MNSTLVTVASSHVLSQYHAHMEFVFNGGIPFDFLASTSVEAWELLYMGAENGRLYLGQELYDYIKSIYVEAGIVGSFPTKTTSQILAATVELMEVICNAIHITLTPFFINNPKESIESVSYVRSLCHDLVLKVDYVRHGGVPCTL